MFDYEQIDAMDIHAEAPNEEPLRQYYFMKKCKEWAAEEEKRLGRKLTLSMQTMGCQMNARDSEKLEAILSYIGYETVEEPVADFVLYNTCTVRENANMKIAMCGCMMQEPTVVEKIQKSYPFVDLVFGTHNVYKLAELLYTRIHSDRMVLDIWKEAEGIVEDLPSVRKYPFKAGVNIMYGCNNFCTYCIVPYVRGRERSRKPKLIEVMAKSKKICTHLHLPLQSGSTEILKKMNRHYTKEQYLDLVVRIKEKMPNISLTTDLIVGFPGETEEDFEETLDVVRKVRYDSVYSFIYSKRTGTPAARMENQVPEDVVKERFARLLDVIHEISTEITDAKEGEIVEALMEEVNDHDENLITGRLSSNAVVHCPGDKSLIGKICKVKLTESKGFYFMGEIQ